MEQLLIQLVLDGYTVKISDSGFAMKDAIVMELSKTSPKGTKWFSERVVGHYHEQSLESILAEMRYDVHNKITMEY